jgi:hypothetical protein
MLAHLSDDLTLNRYHRLVSDDMGDDNGILILNTLRA